jgi:3-deoxy-D-arabino-heptulosonate 7-phosphate (DAHP) synthase
MTKGTTPDEKFLIAAYRRSLKAEEGLVDIATAAKDVGLRETATKNIVKHLAQANFVLKRGESQIVLTERGVAFVKTLT